MYHLCTKSAQKPYLLFGTEEGTKSLYHLTQDEKKKIRTKVGFSDHSVMQAAGLVLVLLLDLSDFLQEKNCIGEKKRKGIRNLLEGKEIRIRSALQYRRFVSFIMLNIVLILNIYVD